VLPNLPLFSKTAENTTQGFDILTGKGLRHFRNLKRPTLSGLKKGNNTVRQAANIPRFRRCRRDRGGPRQQPFDSPYPVFRICFHLLEIGQDSLILGI
jgi:hypothetical protein